MVQPEIKYIRPDGTAIGERDGLYLGTPVEVPFDEIEVELEDEGDLIYKTHRAAGVVIGREKLTRDQETDEQWEAKKRITPPAKVFVTLPDGEQIERTQTVYTWEKLNG